MAREATETETAREQPHGQLPETESGVSPEEVLLRKIFGEDDPPPLSVSETSGESSSWSVSYSDGKSRITRTVVRSSSGEANLEPRDNVTMEIDQTLARLGPGIERLHTDLDEILSRLRTTRIHVPA